MEKDVAKTSKKMGKNGVAKLIDYVLASNMRSMTKLAIIKGRLESTRSSSRVNKDKMSANYLLRSKEWGKL